MAARRPSAPQPDSNTGRVTVPRLNTDPVWSLKPWPAVVTVGGQRVEIPAMPAAEWLAILMEADLDLLITEFMPEIEEQIYDGILELDDVYLVCLDLIALVSARPWWVTLRLIGFAKNSWDVLGGELVYRHIDPTTLSLAAWLDALLLIALRAMDPKEVTMFNLQLEQPPEDVPGVEAKEPEMSASAFLAMGR